MGTKHPVKNTMESETYSCALGVRLDLKRSMMLPTAAEHCWRWDRAAYHSQGL